MRSVGIDIASETHVVAVVGEDGAVLLKATPFQEDSVGYALLLEKLGDPGDTLITLEATGHYWKNLFAALAARGFSIALINPLRSRRFAQEDLERTKTDAIDALGLARFGAQKRPRVTRVPDAATGVIVWAMRWRSNSSMRPRSRWALITAPPIRCRCVTCAKTWMCCAHASLISIATSRTNWRCTKSGRC